MIVLDIQIEDALIQVHHADQLLAVGSPQPDPFHRLAPYDGISDMTASPTHYGEGGMAVEALGSLTESPGLAFTGASPFHYLAAMERARAARQTRPLLRLWSRLEGRRE
jgi:hypothetical protein